MRAKITVAANEAEFDRQAAERIVEGLRGGSCGGGVWGDGVCADPPPVVGLSTGRTTGNMHRLAVEMWREEAFDISGATVFGLDEVTGVDKHFAGACWEMLWTEIVEGLVKGGDCAEAMSGGGFRPENFVMLPTESDDFARECLVFEGELERRGGISLLMLGLGENGHLGFNQPGTPFGQTTWMGAMEPVLEERLRRESGTPADKKLGGVTLGVRNIMLARRIVLVAKGAGKARAVKRMLTGPVSSDFPASVLQLHPNCEFLLDAEAAALL